MAAEPRDISIDVDGGGRTTAVVYPSIPPSATAVIVAHGAGAGQRQHFITGFAHAISSHGIDVVTFNFLYMEQRRRAPDRLPQLIACYRSVISTVREELPSARNRLCIGGKSMGGRVATHVAAEDPSLPIAGIILLGYPLHPPGKPDQLRDAHLPNVKRPMLFLQGSRDVFGTPSELKPILASLSPLPTLRTIDGGDHSFKVAGRNPDKQGVVYREVEETVVGWIGALMA